MSLSPRSPEALRAERTRIDGVTRRAIDSLGRSTDRAAAIRTLASVFGDRSQVELLESETVSRALELTHGDEHRRLTTALENVIRPHADAQRVITMSNGVCVQLADTLNGSKVSPIRQHTHDGRPYGSYCLMAREGGDTRMQSITTFIRNLPPERN